MHKIYLDNAATTRVREEVIEPMQHALANSYGNPSSTHSFGRTARTAIEQARKSIARLINAQAAEIIFTSGGTEADNMILRSAVRDLGVKTLITSKIEHHAVLHTAEALAAEYGIGLRFVKLDENGNPMPAHLKELLEATEGKALVSLMHINNEIGNITDIETCCRYAKEYGAYFHSDTVQSIGHYPWDVQRIPADFLVAAAHKFHGPKGIGFAFIRKHSGLKPILSGGAQERGYRAGTEAFHNIVGLEAAMLAAYSRLEEEQTYISGLKAYFVKELLAALPGVTFNGLCADPARSTYTLLNVCLPFSEAKAAMLIFHLDLKGIACSRGSACQSGSVNDSHVLAEILPGEALRRPSVRFSFSKYNTKEELAYVVGVLRDFSED